MTSSFYWPLFEHMATEHGLTLTDSELEEIRLIANTMKRPTRYKSKTAEQAAKGYNEFLKRRGQPATTKWTKRKVK